MLRAIVFDCDGVLLQSVSAKTQAFMDVVAEHGPEASEFIRDYHEAHGGVSRARKFEYFYETWLKRPITAQELADLGRRFSDHCLTRVLECLMVPGASECLDTLYGTLPMWVASGTPQDELRMILDRRGLAHYFEGIYGSPDTKDLILQRIIDTHDFDPKEVLMVGDSGTDLGAAEAVGCLFYGCGEFAGHPWAEDLRGLADFVKNGGTA